DRAVVAFDLLVSGCGCERVSRPLVKDCFRLTPRERGQDRRVRGGNLIHRLDQILAVALTDTRGAGRIIDAKYACWLSHGLSLTPENSFEYLGRVAYL